MWKIAPGERAGMWDDCRAGGFICVAWSEVGDLTAYQEKPDLIERMQSVVLDLGRWARNRWTTLPRFDLPC